MKRICMVWAALGVLVLSGCSSTPDALAVAAAVQGTLTAAPTRTAMPTATATVVPSATARPTHTASPTPTSTPRPSATPTAVPTCTLLPTAAATPAWQVAGPASGAFEVKCPFSWRMYKDIGMEVSFYTDGGSVIMTGCLHRHPQDPGPFTEGRLLWWENSRIISRAGTRDAVISSYRRASNGGEIISVASCEEVLGMSCVYHFVWCDMGDMGMYVSERLDGDSLSEADRDRLLDLVESVVIDRERLEEAYSEVLADEGGQSAGLPAQADQA